MYWQHTPYTIPLLISAVFSAAIGLYIYRYRAAPGATPLALLFAAVSLWALEYALELALVPTHAKHFLASLQYTSISLVSVLWLTFALQYTGRSHWARGNRQILLYLLPFFTAALAWTDADYGLLRSRFNLVDLDGAIVLSVAEYGPWFWVHTAYSYGLFFVGTLLILPFFIRSPHLYRSQLAASLVGLFAPWLANALYIFGLSPWPHLDLTPFAFIIMGLVTVWALFRFQLFDLIPAARHEVIEGLRDGVAIFDLQDRLLDANPSARAILHLKNNDAIGLPPTEALAGIKEIELPLRETTGLEVRLERDDELCYYELLISVLHDRHHRHSGHLLVFHDITERKLAEEELVRSQRLRAAGELSLGVSHNLNNILTGILGPAHLLKEMIPDGEAGEYIDMILHSSQRARDLVQQLRRTVAEEGSELQAVDLKRAVQEAIKGAQPRWKDEAEASGIHIEIETHFADAPIAAADPVGLHDILLNLLFNAVDALPNGGTISIATCRVGDRVELVISDDGIGMDEETRRRVFEPFFTTKMNIGTGLGLSTAYATMQRWEGHIAVESTLNKGTTFTLHIPHWQGELPAAERAKEDKSPALVAPEKAKLGRILLAEDEAIIGMLMEGRLKKLGHELVYASDADEALAQFFPGKFDIAIIDLGIPGRPGDELARLFKEKDPHIRTLLVTGWDLNEDDPRRQPFDLYVKKPFDVRRVERAVAQLLSQQKAET